MVCFIKAILNIKDI